MKIAMVTTSLSQRGAGVSKSAEDLSHAMVGAGEIIHVFGCDGTGAEAVRNPSWFAAPASLLPAVGPVGFGYAPRLVDELLGWDADVTHLHGLWLLNVRSVRQWAHRSRRAYIVSPHGMLSPHALSYSRAKKSIASALYHARALSEASCLHATSEQEHRDIRAYGLKQPVTIVPHGATLPVVDRSATRRNVVLSLGRLHPIKGLDRLITAWSRVEQDFPEWHLDIQGPDEGGYRKELQRQVQQLGAQRVSIGGPVVGDAKFAALGEASIFVLPSLSENFAMTVVESLSVATPVISTKGAPWSGLETNGCGWWVDHGPEALAEALRGAMSLAASERGAMGERGRAWMERDFQWPGVAARMAEVYRWLHKGGQRPAHVVLD